MFIKLKLKYDTNHIWLNPFHIAVLIGPDSDGCTLIKLSTQETFNVKETPEEISELASHL